jgi:hypothetical protein
MNLLITKVMNYIFKMNLSAEYSAKNKGFFVK